jgi:hypothetical protein
MFKKRERKVQNQTNHRRRKRDDNDISDDDDDGIGLREILTTTKQRRTLIDHLESKRGVGAHDLLKVSAMNVKISNDITTETVNAVINDPTAADALSTKTQLPTGGSVVAEEQQIWDQKHAAALEEYVQQKLKQTLSHSLNAENRSSSTAQEQQTTSVDHVQKNFTSKEQLYLELAARAVKLSGKKLNQNAISNGSINDVHENDNARDVLTAGAATAIAEVILPVSDRLAAVKATAQAAAMANLTSPAKYPNVRNKSAVPNRFRSSYNHHHPVVGGNVSQHRTNVDAATQPTIDDERVGFAAARQVQQQTNHHHQYKSNSGGNKNVQSTDDRVYQQFIKRQREQQSR